MLVGLIKWLRGRDLDLGYPGSYPGSTIFILVCDVGQVPELL